MTTTPRCPKGSPSSSRYVDDWARPTRAERYAVRLSKTVRRAGRVLRRHRAPRRGRDRLPRRLDLGALPDDAARLLQLLYSMILVSYAVNIFHQPRIPDSGAAFFDMVVEPAV